MFSDTVISCFPQRWDTWSTDFRIRPPHPPAMLPTHAGHASRHPPLNPGGPLKSRQRPPPPLPANWPVAPPPPRQTVPEPAELSQLQSDAIHTQLPQSEETHDEARVLLDVNDIKSKDKGKNDPPSFLAWMAGKKKKGRKDSIDAGFPLRETRNSRPTSSIEQEEKKRRRAFLQLDPLNVQQTILKHLQGTMRAPLTSAYDLANLVTNSCADVFDQFKTPSEFQFFDFFERSIGALVS
jgi:hypothetical protein